MTMRTVPFFVNLTAFPPRLYQDLLQSMGIPDQPPGQPGLQGEHQFIAVLECAGRRNVAVSPSKDSSSKVLPSSSIFPASILARRGCR